MPPRRRASPPRFRARSRAEWRAWLERNHATVPEVWLVYAKKASGKPTVRYAEAVEEALCFGWIDTTVHPLDANYYLQRFTPRTNLRNWSKLNLDRFDRMVAQGRMTDAGRAKRPPDVAPPADRHDARAPFPRSSAGRWRLTPRRSGRLSRSRPRTGATTCAGSWRPRSPRRASGGSRRRSGGSRPTAGAPTTRQARRRGASPRANGVFVRGKAEPVPSPAKPFRRRVVACTRCSPRGKSPSVCFSRSPPHLSGRPQHRPPRRGTRWPPRSGAGPPS